MLNSDLAKIIRQEKGITVTRESVEELKKKMRANEATLKNNKAYQAYLKKNRRASW